MIKKIFKILFLPWKYKKTLRFLIKKGGIKRLINFLFVKYFVADEGGEISLLNPLITRFPKLACYPYKIEIEITNKCNKRCIICEHTYWQEPPLDLSFEQFKYIIDQFPHLKWINMTGEGSGFLNKDFLKMIEYARSRDISVNFADEFDFLDENIAKKLVELGVNSIWVSMDGATKETYEKIKVGCNFDRAIKNIKNLIRIKKELKSPLPTIYFRFVITTLNFQEMPKMVELVHSFGDLGEGSKLEFIGLLKFKEVEQFYLPTIPKEIKEATKRKAKELNLSVAFTHSELNKLRDVSECAAWHEPYIMMGGYVLPCCAVFMSNRREFLRQHCFGNIFKKPFKEIWYSERYKKFRKMVPKKNSPVPLLCAGCRAFNTSKREKIYGVDKNV
jgi:MoaA/NifB/PqqE/SkfB family radical SAM enzyme